MKDNDKNIFPDCLNYIRNIDPLSVQKINKTTTDEMKLADDFIRQIDTDIVSLNKNTPFNIDDWKKLYNKYCEWKGFKTSEIGDTLALYIKTLEEGKDNAPKDNIFGLIIDIKNILRSNRD